MLAAGLITLIALPIAGAYALAWVMCQAALSEADTENFGGMKASAESFGAGRAEMGADLLVTNANRTIQTEQTNSLHSKPRIKSGRADF